MDNGYAYSSVQSTCGEITQRWLAVFSRQACYKHRKDVYRQKERSSKNQSPQEQEWHIVGELHSDDEAVSRGKQGRGMFIVAASERDPEILK